MAERTDATPFTLTAIRRIERLVAKRCRQVDDDIRLEGTDDARQRLGVRQVDGKVLVTVIERSAQAGGYGRRDRLPGAVHAMRQRAIVPRRSAKREDPSAGVASQPFGDDMPTDKALSTRDQQSRAHASSELPTIRSCDAAHRRAPCAGSSQARPRMRDVSAISS